jgi:hypothetical protein
MKKTCGNIGGAFIWIVVDETTDSVDPFFANLLAGKLDFEVPSNPHLACYKVLYHVHNSTVARFMNERLKLLWPTGIHGEVR